MTPGTIAFSDPTVIEGEGNLQQIKDIMESEGPPVWMIKTRATVVTESIATDFVLHLWNDGRAVITETNHPTTIEAPDDDFRRLSEWCDNHGWSLEVDKFLIENKQNREFWIRLHSAALVHSDILQKLEQEEMSRMKTAYEKDQNEEEEIDYAD